jgi:hypothetical protein
MIEPIIVIVAYRPKPGKESETLDQWLSRWAELLVERKWPQIQKLSHALLEFGKIDRSEITHIVQSREQPHRFE